MHPYDCCGFDVRVRALGSGGGAPAAVRLPSLVCSLLRCRSSTARISNEVFHEVRSQKIYCRIRFFFSNFMPVVALLKGTQGHICCIDFTITIYDVSSARIPTGSGSECFRTIRGHETRILPSS